MKTEQAIIDRFKGRCPYTDKKCESWECSKCPVEKEERKWAASIDKEERRRLAMAEYKAMHRPFTFYLDEATDSDLITWLERQGNKSEAIRRILRKAVKK